MSRATWLLPVRAFVWHRNRSQARRCSSISDGRDVGAILHQRRTFVLQASCVEIDGTGVAFAAPSGNGKSSLTAALLHRGATFASDDICVFNPVGSGTFRVWRGAPRLKLDRASLAEFDGSGNVVYEPAGGDRGK